MCNVIKKLWMFNIYNKFTDLLFKTFEGFKLVAKRTFQNKAYSLAIYYLSSCNEKKCINY